MDHLRYWIGFNRTKGIGPNRLRTLIDHFGNLETAWNASPKALEAAELDQRTLASLMNTRRRIDLDAEVRTIERAGITAVCIDDPLYPPLLKKVPDAPFLLYIKGTLTRADLLSLAVIGTRRATNYGKVVTVQLVEQLVTYGMTIVSGLSHGIDALAHQTAISCGGRTIAVLPCGLDSVYPVDHAALAASISANGALISELPMGTHPDKHHFKSRNRIVSGLSAGVLVIEAGEKSGTLHTADQALEQGRDVFAVPGNITSPSSQGTNALIQAGAKIVLRVEDILEELGLASNSETKETARQVASALPELSEVELAILRLLSPDSLHINDLVQQANLPIAQLTGMLTILEMKGLIRQVGAMEYVATRPV